MSKLRENDKTVIGVGVKKSTSDLLIANCDEFIYYDDLVREAQEGQGRGASDGEERSTDGAARGARRDPSDDKKQEALDLVLETLEALFTERGAEEKIWGSMVKQALKRRKPGLQRVLLRLPLVQQASGGGGGAQAARARARREVGRRDHEGVQSRVVTRLA